MSYKWPIQTQKNVKFLKIILKEGIKLLFYTSHSYYVVKLLKYVFFQNKSNRKFFVDYALKYFIYV